MVGSDRQNSPPAAPVTRPGHSAPDVRLLALGDMLAAAGDAASQPGADILDAASTLTAAAADAYALSYGYGGALAVPSGLRVLARVAVAIDRAASVPLAVPAPNRGEHAAA